MSNSEDVFLTLPQSSFENSLGPSTTTDFCVSRPTSNIATQDVDDGDVTSVSVKVARLDFLGGIPPKFEY